MAGGWCVVCFRANYHKVAMEEAFARVKAIARAKGGLCLSVEYVDSVTHLRWRCAAGHEWEATPTRISSGAWCQRCTGQLRSLEKMHEFAQARGGLCLSTEYNSALRVRWRCAEGHEWETKPGTIRAGRWCAVCAKAKRQARTFAAVQEVARAKGGLCLSPTYVNSLRFRCAKGHEWHAYADAIQRGRWCAICSIATRDDGMRGRAFARVQALARTKGGICLSTEYRNAQTRLRFRCAANHEWETSAKCIMGGSWCPQCRYVGGSNGNYDEYELVGTRGERCRSATQCDVFTLRWRCSQGHEWEAPQTPSRSPSWCPQCAAAMGATIADVEELAEAYGGVCLSTVIQSYASPLRLRCRVGHEFELTVTNLQGGSWCPRCHGTPVGTLEAVVRAVERKGGVLLETEYHSSRASSRVRCGQGHEWTTKTSTLVGGSWCKECSTAAMRGQPRPQYSILDMHELAASRRGRCLSDTYVNTYTHLRWQCHAGHEWETSPSSIRGGSWCPTCATRHRGSIDGMRALAAERGGTCHTRVYQNHKDLLRFTCARGHEFTATGMVVKTGAWCPTCEEQDAPAPERAPTTRRKSSRRPTTKKTTKK